MEKAKRIPKNARWTKKKTAALLLLIVVVSASVVFAWLYGLFGVQVVSDYDESRLGVFFLDVGQGDSILIKSPEGRFMLIDAGTNEGGGELVEMLRSYNVETLEYFVLTHADADHVGGADDVLENFEVKTVLSSDVGADTKTWRDVLDAIEREDCADVTVSVGNRYTLSEDCTFTVLGPVDTETDRNNCSVVLRMDYGETSFLFTGDAEKEAEERMLQRNGREALQADVLKVGHHGSSTSTSAEFLEAVSPSYGVISCGKDNTYGHPHQSTLDRLSAAGVQVLRTDEMGTVILQSDKEQIYAVGRTVETPLERYIAKLKNWVA